MTSSLSAYLLGLFVAVQLVGGLPTLGTRASELRVRGSGCVSHSDWGFVEAADATFNVSACVPDLHAEGTSLTDVLNPPDSAATSTASTTAEAAETWTNHDIKSAEFSRSDIEPLEKRHNWAFTCYDMGTLDKALRDHCVQSYGYSCNSIGKLTSKKPLSTCEEDCGCQDLFPKSKWGAVCFGVGQTKKCVKARNSDLAEVA